MAVMFQHRHYEAIATVLAQQSPVARTKAAYDFAEMFAEDNPRFDRVRFLIAAGVEGPFLRRLKATSA